MFVVITRNFPPDIGGIQSLMEGLSKGLSKSWACKIFADEYPNCKIMIKILILEIKELVV